MRRNLKPQHLGGLEVDHQLELRRPFYREIGGLGSLEDLINVDCGTPVHISQIGSITHEAAKLRKSFFIVDGRQPALDRKIGDPFRKIIYDRAPYPEQGLSPVSFYSCECGL